MIKYLGWFWQVWKTAKKKMVAVIVFTLVTIFAKTAFPIFLKHIVDELDSDYQPANAYKLIIVFLFFALFETFCTSGLPLFRGYLNMLFGVFIRNRYFKIFTCKDYSFFQKFRTGDLLTRLTDDIDGSWMRIYWYSCSGILRPLEAISLLLFTLGVMSYYSWPLTLCTFLPLPFLVFVMAKTEERMLIYTEEKQKSISHCNNVLETCFNGIRVVKTTLSEGDQIASYEKAIEERIRKEKDFLKINQIIHFFAMLVNHLGSIIVVFIGSILMVKGHLSLGTLLLFITYSQTLIEPIWTLSMFYASSKQIFRYVDRLVETEEFPDNPQVEDSKSLSSFKQLSCEEIGFKYQTANEMALSGVNFDLKQGEMVAVVGSVGSGKTTLLDLVFGDLRTMEGMIKINEIPQSQIDPTSFFNRVGYIRQKNLLLSLSIKDNLSLGQDFSPSQIDEALKNALVKEEFTDLSSGFDTVLGQKGVTLSGGQKQRLSVARSLIRTPELLLMDDCTAAMDAATERSFWINLKEVFPHLSYLVTTHRLATARQADRILVLEQGKQIEYGTHEKLMSYSSHYQKIMSSQKMESA